MFKNRPGLIVIVLLLLIVPLSVPSLAQTDSFTAHTIPLDSLMPIARLSPDGTLIAVFHEPRVHEELPLDRYLWLIDANTGDEIEILAATTTISDAAFSSDGSRLVAVQTNGDVYVWDTATRKALSVFAMPFYGGVHSLRFVDEDQVMFVYGQPSRIVFLDTQMGHITRILAPRFDTLVDFNEAVFLPPQAGNYIFTTADLAPDAAAVVVATANNGVFLWDVETRAQTVLREADAMMSADVIKAAFSADGTRLVYTIPRSNQLILYDVDSAAESVLSITVNAFALSPDDDHIVWSQNDVNSVFLAPVGEPDDAELLFELPAGLRFMPRLASLDFSADGSRLLLSGVFNSDGDNALFLFDLAG